MSSKRLRTAGRGRRAAILAATALAVVSAGGVTGVAPAQANTAFGCTFNAYTPFKTAGGTIWTKTVTACSQSKWLVLRGRLKKDDAFSYTLAGSFDQWEYVEAGKPVTRWVWNNQRYCPGNGIYFGKLSIQEGIFGSAYSDRSGSAYIYHC